MPWYNRQVGTIYLAHTATTPVASDVSDAGVRALAEGCPQLQLLDLAGCRKVTDAGVQALAKGCPGLEVLNLGRTGVTLPAAFKRAHPTQYRHRSASVAIFRLLTRQSVALRAPVASASTHATLRAR